MGGGVYREGLYGGGQHAVADNEASDAEFEGTGKASGESMQYKLEGLLNLRALGVGVEVSRTASWDGAGRGTNEWKVTFVHERGEVPGAIGHADARGALLEVLQPGDDGYGHEGDVPLRCQGSVPGEADHNATVVVTPRRGGVRLGGTFALALGDGSEVAFAAAPSGRDQRRASSATSGAAVAVTAPIAHDATGEDVAAALEALPTVGAVSAERIGAFDRNGGATWRVTFFAVGGSLASRAGGDVPLLAADVSALTTGLGALTGTAHAAARELVHTTVTVAEAAKGSGTPAVWKVRTSVEHVNAVQELTLVYSTSFPTHHFQLLLDTRNCTVPSRVPSGAGEAPGGAQPPRAGAERGGRHLSAPLYAHTVGAAADEHVNAGFGTPAYAGAPGLSAAAAKAAGAPDDSYTLDTAAGQGAGDGGDGAYATASGALALEGSARPDQERRAPLSQPAGTRRGESIESLLHAMPNWADLGAAARVRVTRVVDTAKHSIHGAESGWGGNKAEYDVPRSELRRVTWRVTFLDAPHGVPLLQVVEGRHNADHGSGDYYHHMREYTAAGKDGSGEFRSVGRSNHEVGST